MTWILRTMKSIGEQMLKDIFSLWIEPPGKALIFRYVGVDEETAKKRLKLATYTIKKYISAYELEKKEQNHAR